MKKILFTILLLLSINIYADNTFVETSVSNAQYVIVTIVRELPEETVLIKRTLDVDEFYMWMTNKMEEGCDPYVSDVKIKFVENVNDF